MLISNVHKSIIAMNSLDARFSKNVFEAVKTSSTCFMRSKITRLRLVVLNPIKTLLLVKVLRPRETLGETLFKVSEATLFLLCRCTEYFYVASYAVSCCFSLLLQSVSRIFLLVVWFSLLSNISVGSHLKGIIQGIIYVF